MSNWRGSIVLHQVHSHHTYTNIQNKTKNFYLWHFCVLFFHRNIATSWNKRLEVRDNIALSNTIGIQRKCLSFLFFSSSSLAVFVFNPLLVLMLVFFSFFVFNLNSSYVLYFVCLSVSHNMLFTFFCALFFIVFCAESKFTFYFFVYQLSMNIFLFICFLD